MRNTYWSIYIYYSWTFLNNLYNLTVHALTLHFQESWERLGLWRRVRRWSSRRVMLVLWSHILPQPMGLHPPIRPQSPHQLDPSGGMVIFHENIPPKKGISLLLIGLHSASQVIRAFLSLIIDDHCSISPDSSHSLSPLSLPRGQVQVPDTGCGPHSAIVTPDPAPWHHPIWTNSNNSICPMKMEKNIFFIYIYMKYIYICDI